MVTVAEAVSNLTRDFTASPSARLDARILIGHVLGLEPGLLFARGDLEVAPENMETITALARRRMAHEPVARILGVREFYGLPFRLSADTLDPRADTETLINAVLESRARFSAPQLLDLGTGSGCILLALLHEWTDARGIGIDISPGAVATAGENAIRLNLESRASFAVGNWTEGLAGPFDIIVSNPPYISSAEMEDLAPDVRLYDPLRALTGGADGLEAYRTLIGPAAALLAPHGRLFLEVGATQADAVAELLVASGVRVLKIHRDLSGHLRCIAAERAFTP